MFIQTYGLNYQKRDNLSSTCANIAHVELELEKKITYYERKHWNAIAFFDFFCMGFSLRP